MNATRWITRRAMPGPRPLVERLEATLRRHGEALAPRTLRRTLDELKAVVDARVSEVVVERQFRAARRFKSSVGEPPCGVKVDQYQSTVSPALIVAWSAPTGGETPLTL